MSKYQENIVFGPVDKKLAASLTPVEVGMILSNKTSVPNRENFLVTLETGREMNGTTYCSLFEHFVSLLYKGTVSLETFAPQLPPNSQATYEAAYWAYVNCGTSDVNEPPKLLEAMVDKIDNLDITHVIDEKKTPLFPVFATGVILPILAVLVFLLIGLI